MGHWYDKEGCTQYEIVGANGKKRDTTLRDARKFGWFPSVTTIMAIISKPQLEVWKTNQVLDAAIDYQPPRRVHDQFEYDGWEAEVKKWKAIVIDKSQKIGKDSAKKGSELHDTLEKEIKEKSFACSEDYSKFTLPVYQSLSDNFGSATDWISEKSFSHKLGFGGKVDLHSDDVILDFKTKSSSADFHKDLSYFENAMQLAAYRLGLDKPKAVCYNLYISTEVPGCLQLKKWTEEEVQRAEKAFLHLLGYWQLVNNIGNI